MATGVCDSLTESHVGGGNGKEERDWKGLDDAMYAQFRIHLPITEEEREGIKPEVLEERIGASVKAAYDTREEKFTPDVMRHLERVITLQSIDAHLKDHLLAWTNGRMASGCAGTGSNPLQEYQREVRHVWDMLGRSSRRRREDVPVQIAEQDVDRIEETAGGATSR
jgi:preprotein translocase subunit SecA